MVVQGEKVKQACWCFSGTSRAMAPLNKTVSRNRKMLDDAGDFHKKLATVEKRFTHLNKSTDSLLGSVDELLSDLQPGVYDNNAEGGSSIIPGSNTAHMPASQLHRASAVELKSTLMDPIADWQSDYTRVKTNWSKQEHAALLVDKFRRAYYKKTNKHLKETVLKTDAINVPLPAREQDPDLQQAEVTHDKIEAELHTELVALVDKAKHVKMFISSGLGLEANALKAASEKISLTNGVAQPGNGHAVGQTML